MRNNTEWNGNDRRQSQRWNLKIPLRVFQAHSEVVVGHLVNVSLHGMRIVSGHRFDDERLMNLDLELPDGDGQWRRATVTVMSVHSQLDPENGGYSSGFEFVSVAPETLFSLQKLLDDMASFR